MTDLPSDPAPTPSADLSPSHPEDGGSASNLGTFRWANTGGDGGEFTTPEELWGVLARLEHTPAYRWVMVWSTGGGGGDGRTGLVIGDPSRGLRLRVDGPLHIVPAGAEPGPIENVGSWLAPFWAVPAELVGAHTAAAVLVEWLQNGVIPNGYEYRDAD